MSREAALPNHLKKTKERLRVDAEDTRAGVRELLKGLADGPALRTRPLGERSFFWEALAGSLTDVHRLHKATLMFMNGEEKHTFECELEEFYRDVSNIVDPLLAAVDHSAMHWYHKAVSKNMSQSRQRKE